MITSTIVRLSDRQMDRQNCYISIALCTDVPCWHAINNRPTRYMPVYFTTLSQPHVLIHVHPSNPTGPVVLRLPGQAVAFFTLGVEWMAILIDFSFDRHSQPETHRYTISFYYRTVIYEKPAPCVIQHQRVSGRTQMSDHSCAITYALQ